MIYPYIEGGKLQDIVDAKSFKQKDSSGNMHVHGR